MCVVWLRSEAFDLGEFDDALVPGTDRLALELDRLSLLLCFTSALGVGLDSVQDFGGMVRKKAQVLARTLDWYLHSSLDREWVMCSTRTFTRFSRYRLPTFL